MKKYNTFKKLLCLAAAFVFAVSAAGCNDEATESTSSALPSSPQNSEKTDILDPENNDLSTEQGAEVKAEELEVKEGKANGVDVSKWQGKIDWSKVKKSGIDFAIIRIGFRGENGIIYKDDCADYNIQQADKAGLLVGVYFFSTATTTAEAVEEAKWTVSAIEGYPISYPVVYDCEGFNNYDSRMYGLSNSQRTDNALAFLKHIEQNGYEGMLYSAKNELEGSIYWDTARIENAYSVWVARYPANPYPKTVSPDYGGKYDMWQYTDKGAVSGITGNADLSVSYFTRQKTAAKNPSARPENAKAPTASDNTYTSVSDEVTAKIETNLRDAATTKSNILGTLKNGTFLKRTATGSNGWSKLTYNGKTVYAITSYLTTDKNYKPQDSVSVSDDFEPASGQVTAKDETNLRAEPNTNSAIIATIKNGEFVTRVGISPSGWTRVNVGGKIAYAKTSLLTTEVNSSSSQNEPVSDGFEPSSGKVTAKDETNLRAEPNTNSEIVATIKNGEFVTRVGVSPTGWTKVNYNGKTAYAKTSLLTTEVNSSSSQNEPVSDGFSPASGKVTAKTETNLRTAPSTQNSEIVHTLKNGEFAELIGKHTNGWAKLTFNGQTVYAVSSYLLSEEDYNSQNG